MLRPLTAFCCRRDFVIAHALPIQTGTCFGLCSLWVTRASTSSCRRWALISTDRVPLLSQVAFCFLGVSSSWMTFAPFLPECRVSLTSCLSPTLSRVVRFGGDSSLTTPYRGRSSCRSCTSWTRFSTRRHVLMPMLSAMLATNVFQAPLSPHLRA